MPAAVLGPPEFALPFLRGLCSSDAAGQVEFEEGCGAFNLVCVTETLNVARMIVGIDDGDSDILKLIPRLPSSWEGFTEKNLRITAEAGTAVVDIDFKIAEGKQAFRMTSKPRKEIRLGLPDGNGWRWMNWKNTDKIIPEP